MASTSLPVPARGILEARHSGIREISNLAVEVPGAIRLEVGQPDFMTPAHIGEAAKRAIDGGFMFYTQTQGLTSLRELLAEKLWRVNSISAEPTRIACGPGAVGAMAAAVRAVAEPGDEVLLPDPHWPNYVLMLSATGTRGLFYPCPPEAGFMPDLERLESLIGPRTRALIVNSPNNPTGAVYPRDVLEAMAEIALRHNLWVLSDECYDQIVLEGPPVAESFVNVLDDPRVISVFSFSKTYAMTGWRLGYAVGSRDAIDTVTKVLESSSSCPSTITQKAGEAALSGPQDCVAEMVSAYRRRRDLVADLLREAGLLTTLPRGAFYVMADVTPSGLTSTEFAFRLLRERGVGVAPGTAFGSVAAGAVRISLASSDQDLREGVGRLCEMVGRLAAG